MIEIRSLPPGFPTLEAWAYSLDRSPHVIPVSPLSQHMTLLLVSTSAVEDEDTRAFVITHPEKLDELIQATTATDRLLFFTVLRRDVLSPAVCPAGLTASSWD